MIPREILKKIRQIEIRTNRIVSEFAVGARASARFTVRTPATSQTNPALNFIRSLKRRERRAPARRNSKLSNSRGLVIVANSPQLKTRAAIISPN
jgi:hypothetical protein